MFGVILWSDPDVGKAVIWCEDQGDLAYYETSETALYDSSLFFDPGDYVEFDVIIENDLRRASNAQTILAADYPLVAHTLDGVNRLSPSLPDSEKNAATSAQVINLSDHLRGRTCTYSEREITRRG